jgi:fructose-bisphosphate aldolase class I
LKHDSNKYKEELIKNALYLSTPGKGVLATDEQNSTCGKRIAVIGLDNTEENRRNWRDVLYTTPDLEKYCVGVIMYDETGKQETNGVKFPKYLNDKGILPGIKVDTGLKEIEFSNGEKRTVGHDDLAERVQEYYELGFRFAKWRSTINIGQDLPSETTVKEIAFSLARYAKICQAYGLVPVVEPEILMDGDHTIEKCADVAEHVQNTVVGELIAQKCMLEGLIIKPSMVTEGADCPKKATPEDVAFYTVRTLSRTIPAAVPGITFLSGGQSEEKASQNLNAINNIGTLRRPWNLSFSFGRALQNSVLSTWNGKPENIKAAQDRLCERVQASSEAAYGKYGGGKGDNVDTFVKGYTY